MKLFTLGPVEMFNYTLEESAKQIPYFRTPEFSKIVLECEDMIKEFANAQERDRVLFLTASGTGAMEAAVINCLTEKDKALVIDGGSFGHRFVQLCELHHIPHVILKLQPGQALTREHLAVYEDMDLTSLLVNIDETSTGQLYSSEMLSEFCKKKKLFYIVDAISSFLADPFDFSTHGMGVAIFSSQKAMALAPGLSVVLLSESTIKERVNNIASGSMYFDFKDLLANGTRGQTPFTPAVGIILQLHNRLLHIKKAGVQNVVLHTKEVAEDFRNRVHELHVELPEYPLSNACTPLIFKNGNAMEVYEALKNQYDIVLTPNGGTLAQTVLRVGHLGNHTIEDNIFLIEHMKKVMCD